MRKGEVLGLTWCHVNLEGGEFYVTQALGKDMVVCDPKTERSKRWITLNENTLARLREWKAEQARQLEELDALNPAGLAERGLDAKGYRHVLQGRDTQVITNEVGGFTNSDTYARWFRGFCVENGFGRYANKSPYRDKGGVLRYRRTGYVGLNYHELRHTQATLLISSGADIKTVQGGLGHSSASQTMNIYAHVIHQNDEKAAVAMEGLLAGHKCDEEDAPLPQSSKDRHAAVEDEGPAILPTLAKAVTDKDKVLALFASLPGGAQLTRREICERCGITGEKRRRTLVKSLADEGMRVKSGSTKSARYEMGTK